MAAPGRVLPRPGSTRRSRSSPGRPRPTGKRPGGAGVLALGVPVALYAAGAWQRRWVAEDGFITLRVVEQILAGNGPVFNAGERVEASTSPAWTLILAVVGLLTPFPLEGIAVLMGWAAAVAGLTLAGLTARRLWLGALDAGGARAGVLVPCGLLVVAAVAVFRDFATSGLETGLTFCWLGGSAFLLAAEAQGPPRGRWWWAPMVAGFGPLVRPDLALVAGPLVVALVVLRQPAGAPAARVAAAARVAGAAVALPVVWQVFRMGYYGALVPNTALAKEGTQAWWEQGWRYFADLAGRYWLAVPLAAAAVAGIGGLRAAAPVRWRHRVAAGAPVAGGLLHGLYVVRVGGDFMHGRLLLPGLFAVLIPVMVVRVIRPRQWPAVLVVAAWALAVPLQVAQGPAFTPGQITDERAFWLSSTGHPNPVLVDDFRSHTHWRTGNLARQHRKAGGQGFGWRVHLDREEYAFVPMAPGRQARVGIEYAHVGIFGVAAGHEVRVVDVLGLGDPLAARLRLEGPRSRPGHEKHIPREWVWAREVAPGTPLQPGLSPVGVDAARRALECPELQRLHQATSARLTPGRFLGNLVDAFRLHGLRIDPDPVEAERQLCR